MAARDTVPGTKGGRFAAAACTAVVLGVLLGGCGLFPTGSGSDGGRGPGIAVGNCLRDPARDQAGQDDGGGQGNAAAAGLTVVPCEEPHDYEAIGAMDLTGEVYPGEDEVRRSAEDFCLPEFGRFVGIPHADSALLLRYVHPTADSWEAGDRTITCLVSGEGQTTGSLRNARR
jgi:Septum formation